MNESIDIQIQMRIDKNLSFVIYRFPGEKTLFLTDFACAEPFHYSFFDELPCDKGFVVFPFDSKETKGWWFHPGETLKFRYDELHQIPSEYVENPPMVSQMDFIEYAEQFDEMQKELKSGKLKKVVLSRIINRPGNIRKHISLLFSQLCIDNPNAFVYLLSTPETGIWAGASPELLIKKEENDYTLVSLAGTRHHHDSNPQKWDIKELEEQEIVSDFIDKLLRNSGIQNYKKSGPSITQANLVAHLKTVYKFNTDALSKRLGEFIHTLHPTPAIGGEPQKTAMNIIRQIERHKRKYYGGFLGTVSTGHLRLYVNIRCINIEREHAMLYVGGGLTKHSNVEDEWLETELKAKTLLKIVDKINR